MGVFLILFSTLVMEARLHLNLELTDSSSLAIQLAPGITCLRLPSPGILGGLTYLPGCWDVKVGTLVGFHTYLLSLTFFFFNFYSSLIYYILTEVTPFSIPSTQGYPPNMA